MGVCQSPSQTQGREKRRPERDPAGCADVSAARSWRQTGRAEAARGGTGRVRPRGRAGGPRTGPVCFLLAARRAARAEAPAPRPPPRRASTHRRRQLLLERPSICAATWLQFRGPLCATSLSNFSSSCAAARTSRGHASASSSLVARRARDRPAGVRAPGCPTVSCHLTSQPAAGDARRRDSARAAPGCAPRASKQPYGASYPQAAVCWRKLFRLVQAATCDSSASRARFTATARLAADKAACDALAS